MFEILAKRKVLKVLEEINKGRGKQFREVFLILKRSPIPFRELDVVELRDYENMYRIRVGDYRMVYEILWAERRIIIHYIAPREKACGRKKVGHVVRLAQIFISQSPIMMLEMSELSEILNQIREELKELRLLYKGLAEKLIPVEGSKPDERKAIKEEDELVNEDELFKALEE